jgi:hypothetical protein
VRTSPLVESPIDISRLQIDAVDMATPRKISPLESPYRVEPSSGGQFAVWSRSGAAVEAFASRRQAATYIRDRVAEDKIFEAAQRFINIATETLMRECSINRAAARLWIRDAADSSR